MANIKIRIAEAADVPGLACLFHQTVVTHGPEHYTPEQTAAWAHSATETEAFHRFILDATTLVALDSEGIAGFGGLAEDGHITALYVRYDCLRQGVGSALMEEILKRARERHLPRLYAEASHFSLGLFQKFGFSHYATEIVERRGVEFQRFLVERKLSGN